jgi:tripartite-type tricarboxylate transporter receptor subunit TctC
MWRAKWLRRALPVALLGVLLAAARASPGDTTTAPVEFPTHPVRLVIGFAPGTPPDVAARALGEKLSQSWKKAVVIENMPGASGNIAGSHVARAEPDGHTLLLAANSGVVMNPILYRKMPFDPLKDLAPISIAYSYPNILAVHQDVDARSVQELVALARTRPGALTCASAGTGTTQHLSCEMLKSMAGIDILHVPYSGAANLWTDLIAGRVDIFFGAPTNVLAYARDGKVRALAVSSVRRFAGAPELSTIAESGFPDFDVTVWWGLMAPAGTPREMLEKLHRDIVKALVSQEIQQRFHAMGFDIVASSPDEFSATIRADLPKWVKIIKEAGIRLD